MLLVVLSRGPCFVVVVGAVIHGVNLITRSTVGGSVVR